MHPIAEQFKIRASAAGQIMAGSTGISETQLKRLDELQKRWNGEGKPLTENMKAELLDLINKRDNPQVSAGTVTYLKNALQAKIMNRSKQVFAPALAKGNIVESSGLDIIADYLGYPMLIQNETHFEDHWKMGTPDVVLPNLIIDQKNSMDWSTFPLFESDIDKGYYAQAQVYMDLSKVEDFKLIYLLQDTPEFLIESEVRKRAFFTGHDPEDADLYQEVYNELTYADIPAPFKIKVYDIKHDPEWIKTLHKQVELCRAELDRMITELPNHIKDLL